MKKDYESYLQPKHYFMEDPDKPRKFNLKERLID